MLALTLRRFQKKNCVGLGNNEGNLFDVKNMDKSQEFECGPIFVYVRFVH